MRPYKALPLIASLISFPSLAFGSGPIVFIDTQTDVMFGPSGTITALREAWLFDDRYSSYTLKNLANDSKAARAHALDRLADLNMTSLQEHGDFVVAFDGTARVGFSKPIDCALTERTDKRLLLRFTLPLLRPIEPIRPFLFQILDPADIAAFDRFARVQPTTLVNAPASCSIKRVAGSEAADAQNADGQIDKTSAYTVVSCAPK